MPMELVAALVAHLSHSCSMEGFGIGLSSRSCPQRPAPHPSAPLHLSQPRPFIAWLLCGPAACRTMGLGFGFLHQFFCDINHRPQDGLENHVLSRKGHMWIPSLVEHDHFARLTTNPKSSFFIAILG